MISMLGPVPDVLLPDLLAGAAKPDASPTSSPGITADCLGGKRGHLPQIAKSRKLPVMPHSARYLAWSVAFSLRRTKFGIRLTLPF